MRFQSSMNGGRAVSLIFLMTARRPLRAPFFRRAALAPPRHTPLNAAKYGLHIILL